MQGAPLQLLQSGMNLRHGRMASLGAIALIATCIPLPPRSATRRAIDKMFSSNGIELRRVIEAGGCFGIKQLVQLNLGVGLVHDICMVTDKDRDLHVIDVSNLFPKFEVSAIHKKNRHLTLVHKTFLDTLSNSLPPRFSKKVPPHWGASRR